MDRNRTETIHEKGEVDGEKGTTNDRVDDWNKYRDKCKSKIMEMDIEKNREIDRAN